MPEGLINVNGDNVQALEILFLTTMITLLPSFVVMMTSFTRYIISFSFLRNAMGTQQTPPNLVLVGLALILTFFTMSPTITRISQEAYRPYVEEEISQEEFFDRAAVPLKEFMLRNTRPNTLKMGMIMLPPSMISAPFKLLLFVTLNGWELLFSTLVRGFK